MSQPTVLEILNKSADFFKSKGIPNHRLDAQLLIGHVLQLKRFDLYLNFDRPLSEKELDRCREFIRRRANREPLQHILGEVQFRELNLKVDRRALIPRSETELIVDVVKKQAALHNFRRILEIGSGTGAICLSLLREMEDVEIAAVELSLEALQLTAENARKNNLSLEGKLFQGDFFSPFPSDSKWDCVVSNPPYVSRSILEDLEPEVRDYDPSLALLGGDMGWETPLRLIGESFSRLHERGCLIMEIGYDQASVLKEKAGQWKWREIETVMDFGGVGRFLVLHR